MITVATAKRSLHGISPVDLNRILKAFGYWPVPADETALTVGCITAIWFCDYLACLNILADAVRENLLEHLVPKLKDVQEFAKPVDDAVCEDYCCRLADRRYLYLPTQTCVDLQTGKTFTAPPVPHVEKTIFDLRMLYLRRARDVHEPAASA